MPVFTKIFKAFFDGLLLKGVVVQLDTRLAPIGPEIYNDRLAMKRALSVKQGLINLGINSHIIHAESKGEYELLVKTQDGVREPTNRRSQITFE